MWGKTMATALLIAGVAASPVNGQNLGFDGENFVKAVRDKDNDKALDLLQKRHNSVINARDPSGDTALTVALARRDEAWSGFLLKEGSDPNYPRGNGDTPLIVASRVGFEQGVEWLLSLGAKVDAANRMGETPLIVAVQARQPDIVKLLLDKGANPDKTDNAAGYSARDYARRDGRAGEIVALLDSAKKKPLPKTDKLDDFKLK